MTEPVLVGFIGVTGFIIGPAVAAYLVVVALLMIVKTGMEYTRGRNLVFDHIDAQIEAVQLEHALMKDSGIASEVYVVRGAAPRTKLEKRTLQAMIAALSSGDRAVLQDAKPGVEAKCVTVSDEDLASEVHE